MREQRTSSRASGRRGRLALAVGLVGAVLATTAGPAGAVNVDLGPRVVSADPADWTPQVMDGAVKGITRIGDRIVAVGTFTTVRQTLTGPDLTRNGVFAFDAATGVIDPAFAPSLGAGGANSVDTDGTHVYVGGAFGSVNGSTATRRVARFTAAGGLVPGLDVPSAAVNEVVVRGSRLFVGGGFTSVSGTPRAGLAALDTVTGDVLPGVAVPFTGTFNGGTTSITRMDLDAAGTRLVAVGNFTTVGGEPREQIAVVDTPATGAASVSSWATDRYSRALNGCAPVFNTFMRDVDISADGSFFAVNTTGAFAGGASSGTLCDTATRWETATGPGQQPTWVAYTGGDTSYGVAIAGEVIYTGGHFRWLNNPFEGDQAGPGAVPREGIAALDARNGLPLSWNPGRARGVGAEALFTTPQGLWVGSDTNLIGGERRQRIAFLPLAGGTTLPETSEPVLPGDLFLAERTTAANSGVLHRINAGGSTLLSTDGGPDWAGTSLVSGGNDATWSTPAAVDATVPAGTPTEVFSSEHWGPQSWALPVEAGRTVRLRLYFANQYDGTAQVGQRVFDVLVDGALVLDDLDIVAAVGNRTGTMREVTVTSDGTIDVDLAAVVENPLVNAVEVVDPAAGAGQATAGALLRRPVSATGAPTGPATIASTALDWTTVRGATVVGGTLLHGLPDGNLYARSFDTATAAVGPARLVDLYDDPDSGARIPFPIAQLTGMAFDAGTHRLYYTVAGSPQLFYRYFTPESEVVGAQQFTVPSPVDLSGAAGVVIAGGRLLYGSTVDGALRSVAFTAGRPSGDPTVLSTDGSFRYRSMFAGPTATPVPTGIAHVGATTSTATTLRAQVVLPAGTRPGDQLLLALTLARGDAVPTAPTAGGGWTPLIDRTSASGDLRTLVWARTAVDGDAGRAVAVPLSLRTKHVVIAATYRGAVVDTVAVASETVNRAVHTTAPATASTAGSWVVSSWSDRSSTGTGWTAPSGSTARAQVAATGAGRVTSLLADQGPIAAGPVGGLAATSSASSAKALMATIVLRPA